MFVTFLSVSTKNCIILIRQINKVLELGEISWLVELVVNLMVQLCNFNNQVTDPAPILFACSCFIRLRAANSVGLLPLGDVARWMEMERGADVVLPLLSSVVATDELPVMETAVELAKC